MRRARNPFFKGDSTESSNPFAEADEDLAEENEDAESGIENPDGDSAKEDEGFELPEWIMELPDDLEVGF